MANRIAHNGFEIVVLEDHETIANQCGVGDVAIHADAKGVWIYSVSENMSVDCWGEDPFDSFDDAIQAVKENA